MLEITINSALLILPWNVIIKKGAPLMMIFVLAIFKIKSSPGKITIILAQASLHFAMLSLPPESSKKGDNHMGPSKDDKHDDETDVYVVQDWSPFNWNRSVNAF